MGYTKETIKGVSWVGALRFATRAFSFVRIIVMARLLVPIQFGIYGIAALVLALLEVFTETGVNIILVQEKEKIERHIDSAWIVSIVRGIIIALTLLITAPFISRFFNSKDSLFVIQAISIVPFLRGFINPSAVKFQKELQFHKEFWYRFTILFVDAAIAIGLALITHHAISIVFGLIAGVIFEIFLSFLFISPRPRFNFEKKYIKKILHRGKWVTFFGIFNYLFYNGDNIAVGKFINSASLGLYQMAYSISILPITEVADVFSRVTFPIYTKISEDRSRLKSAFLKTSIVIFLLTTPIGIILFLFPKEIVRIFLGDGWSGITAVLPILAVFGVVRAVSSSMSSLFLAVGKQEYVTIVTLVSLIGLAFPIVPLVIQFGIVGAGAAALIGSIVGLPFALYYVIKILIVKDSKAMV